MLACKPPRFSLAARTRRCSGCASIYPLIEIRKDGFLVASEIQVGAQLWLILLARQIFKCPRCATRSDYRLMRPVRYTPSQETNDPGELRELVADLAAEGMLEPALSHITTEGGAL